LTEICSGNSVGLSVVPFIRAKVAAACVTSDSDCAELAVLKSKIWHDCKGPSYPEIPEISKLS